MNTQRLMIALLAGALLGLAGCRSELNGVYGQRRGRGADSVNGTAVLSRMFAADGAQVRSWTRLSPNIMEYQTIVWIPDDFNAPNPEQLAFFDEWLQRGGRTLIYVGRDYDARVTYWRHAADDPPADKALETARRLALAQANHDRQKAAVPDATVTPWFTLQQDLQYRTVEALEGPWADGIVAADSQLVLGTRLDIPTAEELKTLELKPPQLPTYTVQLKTADDQPLVTEVRSEAWRSSKILVVQNGSFLLNLPLVNREHRKLAGTLIAAAAPQDQVAFLESRAGGPQVLDSEPESKYPTGAEALTVWPINGITMHLVLLGIVFCFAIFPIFGRPRDPEAEPVADFGKHIRALGDLLARAGSASYARHHLEHYQQHVRRDSGVSHLDSRRRGK